ncbi:uncharacterized protein LOC121416087 [Lytechinus variegatus]|uniref:uncharacterized protein LOC121416087 n=1 Tax=Lytechinus variegatus TaxID=7654 RepID=UPI001BB13D70|nr:uncharacterized protein LOC121416087 [Lytechinus variegatus]
MDSYMSSFRWTLLLTVLLLFTRFFMLTTCLPSDFDYTQGASVSYTYTRAELLSYRHTEEVECKPNGYENFPREIKPRKRGKPGGLRRRVRRRRLKTPLPSIVFGNVRSLQNKMDELRANVRYLNEYREASLFCFTETWLHTAIPDSAIEITNFEVVRSDRTAKSAW